MRRIYISGPITGTTDYKERFARAEKAVREKGFDVINPVSIAALLPDSFTHDEYLAVDMAILDQCDGICMLNGWEDSTGAWLEHYIAEHKGLLIFYESEESL